MIRSKKLTVLALAVLAGAVSVPSAMADNPNFELGNLFLGFRATGGQGSTGYVISNIGDSALTFRDATTNVLNFANIGSQLSTQFGATWYERTDLFTGAGASFENDEFGPLAPERNGDQFNTLYVTKRRSILGTAGTPGSTLDPITAGAQQQASNALWATGQVFDNATGTTVTIANNSSLSDFDDNNTTFNSASWNGVFAGGTSSVFGVGSASFAGINAEAVLDLYRIDPANGLGSFEGSIVLDNLGNVSFIVAPIPEPATVAFGLLAGVACLMRRRQAVVA